MVYLDVNVFAYAALAVDELGDAARHILANLSKVKARTSCLTIDELAWVVLRKSDVKTAIAVCRAVLALRDLDVLPVEPADAWEMTVQMERLGLRPRDALHLAVMKRIGERSIVSEDPHFDRARVKRIPIRSFAKSI
jgi:predicted nucleic acid-binding protein